MGDVLTEAMTWLGEKKDTIFLGQSILCPGTKMSDSFKNVPSEKRIEFPVAEELQLGAAIGLALEGFVPICVFPRWNFLLLAANQLVNHLDRIPKYSSFLPKVIIRTAVGPNKPLDPGHQHQDDFSQAFKKMLKTVKIVRLNDPRYVLSAYKAAYADGGPTLLVESC